MEKYYENPKETAETMDSDGWLHSGDIGKWLPNGTLRIIDRMKNFFKLSQGEYISSEKVENVYISCHMIDNIFIYGDGLRSFLVAVVDLNERAVESFLSKQKESESVRDWNDKSSNGDHPEWKDLRNLFNKEEGLEIKRAFLREIQFFGKSKCLNSLETIKNVYSSEEPFSIENDMLTPTLKLKRHVIGRHFSNAIESMYQQGPIAVAN